MSSTAPSFFVFSRPCELLERSAHVLIRVPFAFCPRYLGSSSILVPVGSFGVGLYTPGAKRPNKIAVSQSSGRPPHVTDRRIFIRRYYSAGYFVALTRPHKTAITQRTARLLHITDIIPRDSSGQSHALTRPLSHSVSLDYFTSQTVTYSLARIIPTAFPALDVDFCPADSRGT